MSKIQTFTKKKNYSDNLILVALKGTKKSKTNVNYCNPPPKLQ